MITGVEALPAVHGGPPAKRIKYVVHPLSGVILGSSAAPGYPVYNAIAKHLQ
jgi:hypothetical protein